jgi:hypothetical protein
LSGLLRPETLDDLRLLYPVPDYPEYTPDYIYGAQQLFVHGRDKEHQWTDAEEYISFLEECAAAPDGRAAQQLEALARRHQGTMTIKGKTWHDKARGLAAMAKRALAADCSRFIRNGDPASERWAPYRDWMNRIAVDQKTPGGAGQHTIITFNYDTALEVLRGETHAVVLDPHVEVPQSQIPILKIHGSVNWKIASGRCWIGRPEEGLCCEDNEIALAVPGPAKQRFASDRWRLALAALKTAEAVVFLGYRFPETDADARAKILGALAGSTESHISVHVSLGPDINARDPMRVRMLLTSVFGRRREDDRRDSGRHENSYSLTVHPLFAEDFLCLYTQVGVLAQERDAEPRPGH